MITMTISHQCWFLLFVGCFISYYWSVRFRIKTHTRTFMCKFVNQYDQSLFYYFNYAKQWSEFSRRFRILVSKQKVCELFFIYYFWLKWSYFSVLVFYCWWVVFYLFLIGMFYIKTHTHTFMFTFLWSIQSIVIL